MRDALLGLNRPIKRLIVFLIDGSLCIFSVWFALYLRLGEFVYLSYPYYYAVIAALTLSIPIFILSGLYRAVFRYSGWPALMTVAKAVTIYGVMFSSIFTAIGLMGIPRTLGLIQPIILFIFIGASRAGAYFWLGGEYKRRTGETARERSLIYGAGAAGRQIATALTHNKDIKIVGFLDDNETLNGQVLNGLTIYSAKNLNHHVERLRVNSILLALPSVTRQRRQEIINRIRNTRLSVRTLPSVTDIAQGRINITDIRELDVDDLLGRSPNEPDPSLLGKTISGRNVLITGAGGSIGSELCRQALRQNPNTLILFDHSEFALYTISEELRSLKSQFSFNDVKVITTLGSIKDQERIKKIFSETKPNTVFHAAAYKHVPLVEENIIEGIVNNIYGTKYIAEAALEIGVEDFVLISSDKAVRPTNIMGATKRWSELIIQAYAEEATLTSSKQRFSAVRFGNVLGSSGSVVPLFREQIKNGAPLTVTHRDVTRYFMSIQEAVSLVLQSASIANGGDIHILDMGEPVRIYDLAKNMIELSGLSIRDQNNPSGDIEIKITGLRAGEKLYEELLVDINSSEKTTNPKIWRAREPKLSSGDLKYQLSMLESELNKNNIEGIRKILFGFGI